jgi:streptogramin lyase
VRRLNVDAADNIWLGIYSAGSRRPGKLAKLDQKSGRFTEYTIPEQTAQPYDVAPDPAGNIWFADTPQVDRTALLGRFDPRTQAFAFYPKPQFAADTPKIQVTRDGAVWFAPRGSLDSPGLAVLYPDQDRIGELGAYYLNGPPGYPFKP